MTASNHLSDLAFDRLMTGELEGTALKSTLQDHIVACAMCADRKDQLARSSEEFANLSAGRPGWAERIREGAARRGPAAFLAARGRAFAGAAAAIAAVAAVLLIANPPVADDRRSKGVPLQLEVFVKRRGGGVDSLLFGSRVASGDALRFRVSAATDGFLGLVSADGAGKVASYLPGDAQALLPVRAGSPVVLDDSIVLDDVLGHERLTAFLCRERLDSGRLLAAIRVALAASGGDPARMDVSRLPLPCASATIWFEKALRP